MTDMPSAEDAGVPPHPEWTDEEVIRRVRDGDKALYEIIMRRYDQRLYRVTRAILRNEDDAKDVMQETYVRAYAALGQFAGRSKFSTWLTKIAVHEAQARLRKRHRVQDRTEDETSRTKEWFVSPDAGPETQTLRREAQSLLETAIDSLPDIYRSVFVLREIQEMSTFETAECLGLSEEAVKVRLLRSRKMLRKELFARMGEASSKAFQFRGARCDQIVRNVFAALSIPGNAEAARG